MTLKLIITAIGIGLHFLMEAMNRAPIAYEDETGFHFGEPRI